MKDAPEVYMSPRYCMFVMLHKLHLINGSVLLKLMTNNIDFTLTVVRTK